MNLSTAGLAALEHFGTLQKIVAELAIERDVTKSKLIAARTNEKNVETERLADDNIKPIPGKDFYTKSLAEPDKGATKKKKSA